MKKHLIIPDAHTLPEQSNERFKWLGDFIAEHTPDVIVQMGDWADMHSLSSYDVGKMSGWNKNYRREVTHANEALDILHSRFPRGYKPLLICLGGNHDDARISRFIQEHGEMDGMLSFDDFDFKKRGWKVYPFLAPATIDGITYIHYMPGGLMGRPLGGDNPATKLIKDSHISCTVAHSHIRDFSERTRGDGSRILGLVAGCFVDSSWRPSYAGYLPRGKWWSGVVLKQNVKNGYYDPMFVSYDQVKSKYSRRTPSRGNIKYRSKENKRG